MVDDESSSRSCWLPIILLVIVGGAIGTYVWKNYTGFRKDEPDDEPVRRVKVERPVTNAPSAVPVAEVVPEPVVESPPPPKKSAAELRTEAVAAETEFESRLAEARQKSAGRELVGFGGVRFGEKTDATPMALERQGTADGFGLVLEGPAQKREFLSFGRPKIWVTPQTHRLYRIVFERTLEPPAGETPAAATTNLVRLLEGKLRQQALSIDLEKYPLARRRWVFPFGRTVVTVEECGGCRLKLEAESMTVREAVEAESAAVRREMLAAEAGTRALVSDRYPKAGVARTTGMRLKRGTPKSFCGLVFGALPPYGAKVSEPHAGKRIFYVDYRQTPCRPFLGFAHGKATLAASNGALVKVELFSAGATDGLTDAEYYDRVCRALESGLGVKPADEKPTTPFPTRRYVAGDVEVSIGPEKTGGFFLRAENTVYAALW